MQLQKAQSLLSPIYCVDLKDMMNPKSPDKLYNDMALTAYLSGDYTQTRHLLAQAKRANPQNSHTYMLLGNVYHQQQQSELALEQYRQALILKPDYAEAYANMGLVYFELNRYWEAVDHFCRSLDIRTDDANVFLYLGKTLQHLSLWSQAELAYKAYIRLRPLDYQGYAQMGILVSLQHHNQKAVYFLNQALAREPNLIDIFERIGKLLYVQGKLEEAIEHYRQAFVKESEVQNWYAQLNPEKQQELQAYYPVFHSMLLLALYGLPGVTDAILTTQLQIWGELYANSLTPFHLSFNRNREPQRRLRIGYVSLEFDCHSSAPSVLLLLQHHDPVHFEVFAYSDVNNPDEMTIKFQQFCHHWRTIAGLDNNVVAQMIQDDQIDILVDMMGHTYSSRLLMFALKPAPIQVTGLGFGCPTGIKAMDYFFADPLFIPPEVAPLLTEKIAPISCQIYWSPPEFDVPLKPLPVTENSYVTFGSGNQLYKINAVVIATWCEILTFCPTAHLSLKTQALEDPLLRQEWWQKFEDHGVARERVHLQGISSREQHLQFYGDLDIVLVPFPYSGGISTYESLWMGTPVIALNQIHRTSASILHMIGHSEWIANNRTDYISRAVNLAQNLETLSQARSQLRHDVLASPVCDGNRFAYEVEMAYRHMWHTWLRETDHAL